MELAGKVFQIFENSTRIILNTMIRPFHKTISDEQWKGLMQFVKFGIVGLSNTAVTYLVYILLVSLHCPVMPAYVIGYVIGILNAFYWNNKYVFKEENSRSVLKALIKCFTSYIGSFLLSAALLILWVDVLGISKYIAPLLTLLITIPLNFIMNKFWAFKSES